jgi:hypothetical protein
LQPSLFPFLSSFLHFLSSSSLIYSSLQPVPFLFIFSFLFLSSITERERGRLD